MPSAAEVERAIRKTAADMGVPELANLLVAISRRESGLGQNPVGDSGDSIGPFQENINGRGKGLSREQRMDPVASTRRAIAEIKTVQKKNPGADPGTIAILAQRPREDLRASYRADINAQLQRVGSQEYDGTRPSTAPARTTGTTGAARAPSRPPSAIAQQAAARARQIAAAQGRAYSGDTAGSTGAARGSVQKGSFGGTYVMPVDGTVTNAYGGKQTYSAGKTSDIGSFNNGVDIATAAGTAVRAPVGGVVKKIYDTRYDDRKGQRNAEENSGWGGQVVIQGDDGKEHRLSHAQYASIQVKEGQRVEAGQPTHKVGMSGNATGPHVDWEKWSGGKSEDALKSALMPSSAGAKAYQDAIARQRAARPAAADNYKGMPGFRDAAYVRGRDDQPGAEMGPGSITPPPDGGRWQNLADAGGTSTVEAGTTGATSVGATAGAAGQPNAAVAQAGNALVSTYQGLIQSTEARITQQRRAMDELQRELSGLQAQIAATPPGKEKPKGVQTRINALTGGQEKPGTGLIGQLTEDIRDLEEQRDDYTVRHASAQQTAAGKIKTPQELEQDAAQTDHIKAQTETLRKKLDGTHDPLERANIESQIAAREAEIAARDRATNIQAAGVQLEADRNPSVIRGNEAQAGRLEQQTAESWEMMPYNIDRIIAATDVDTETANKLRETLPAVLEGMWTDIWAKQILTPQELELGKANTDLTRQRAAEIRAMLGPNMERTLAAAGVDRANIASIVQKLPLEIADLTSQTQLRGAQTGLVGAQTGQVGEETRLTRYQADAEAERQRRWSAIEKQIRDNPSMGQGDLDALVLGAANGIQEWSTAYRAQLERQVAQSQQHLQTQQNQMTQQSTDSNVRNQRMGEALGLEQNRVNQVNSTTAALSPGQQGPMRRMAQLGAIAPLVGSEGLRGVATANRMGAMDLNPIMAGYKKFEEMVGGIRSSAPDVRMAPNVTAPPPITMRFTPPTAATNNPSGATTVTAGSGAPTGTPLATTGGNTATSTAATLAPTTSPIDPYAMTAEEMDEQRRRFNVPTGSAA